MSDSVMKHALQRHPAAPAPAGVAVTVHRLPADDPRRGLRLRYEIAGDAALLRWPSPLGDADGSRRDGLWRHTCLEAFVAAAAGDGPGYVEYNFAPSGAWACYRFDGYRAGMRPEPGLVAPRVTMVRPAGSIAAVIEVAAAWPELAPGSAYGLSGGRRASPGRARLGLTAVLEAADGSLSYWALRHPSPQPDFHNEGGFLLEVEVPG